MQTQPPQHRVIPRTGATQGIIAGKLVR